MALDAGFNAAADHDARVRWGERFSILDSWANARPRQDVRVTYIQNANDHSHVRLHQRPFLEGIVSRGGSPFPLMTLTYNGAPGHTSPSVNQWQQFIEDAVREWHEPMGGESESPYSVVTIGEKANEFETSLADMRHAESEVLVAPGLKSTVTRSPGEGVPVVELAPAVRPGSRRRPVPTLDTKAPFYAFSDAGLSCFPEMTTTWHVGNRDGDVLSGLAVQVRELSNRNGDVRLVGRGPGGYAALHVALRMGTGTVVAFSPEMSITGHDGARSQEFVNDVFGDQSFDSDVMARLDVLRALDLFGQGDIRVIIAYNADNWWYVRNHLPSAEKFVRSLRIGTGIIVPFLSGNNDPGVEGRSKQLRAGLRHIGVSWEIELAERK
ncbi:hypothetical protein AAG589_12200 [Isoptericola sp. F-RaC21]|uniref:hypothetical protein n=1 Tax=Isoptericola sp. F-RaC21 TaxID=3141452 RepID=UPI00315BA803